MGGVLRGELVQARQRQVLFCGHALQKLGEDALALSVLIEYGTEGDLGVFAVFRGVL